MSAADKVLGALMRFMGFDHDDAEVLQQAAVNRFQDAKALMHGGTDSSGNQIRGIVDAEARLVRLEEGLAYLIRLQTGQGDQDDAPAILADQTDQSPGED